MSRRLLTFELGRLLIRETRAGKEHAFGATLAGEAGQVVTWSGRDTVELAGRTDIAAAPVKAASQNIQRGNAKRRIKAGSRHHAAVAVSHRLAAMFGKFGGNFDNTLGRNAALASVVFQTVCISGFFQLTQAAFNQNAALWCVHFAADKQLGALNTVGGDQFAVADHQQIIRITVGFGQPKIRTAQEVAGPWMFRAVNYQMSGVGVDGFASCLGCTVGRQRQVISSIALIIEQPLNQSHHQCGVGAGQNGDPAVAFAAGMGGGGVQRRVNHHVFQLTMGTGFGQQATLSLERVAGLTGRSANEQGKAGMGVVGLGVSVVDHVIHRSAGTQTESQAAIWTVGTEVAGAERVKSKTAQNGGASVVGGIHYQ